MEDDTLFWQSFYGNASERHAELYYEKAARSFNMQKNEWINRSEVEGEIENLRIASKYFMTRYEEEKPSAISDPNDQDKFLLVKSLWVRSQRLTLVIMRLEIHQLSSEAEKKFSEAQSLADEMRSDVDKHMQEMSRIHDEAAKSMMSIEDIVNKAEDMVRSSGRSDPAREIEQFIAKYTDPLEFRWDAIPLPVRGLPPEDPKVSKNIVNRRSEEAYLLQMLKRSNKLGLYGPMGSGKTTLVLKLWNNAEMATIFPDGGIWIQAARSSLEDIPGIIASSLSETLVRSSPLIIQATEVFHLLNGKKVLIVLDGAKSKDEVDFIRKCVPPSCTLLVTSSAIRCLQSLEGETFTLGPLDVPEAVSLLRAWCNNSMMYENFYTAIEQEICHELAGLPLAIELVGRYIRQSNYNLHQVYDHLRSLKSGDISAGNRALSKALALCITGLSEDSIDLLKKLSGMRIKYFSRDILQAMHDVPETIQLSNLLELGLLRSDQLDEFYLAPLLPIILNNRIHQDLLQGRSGLQIFDFLKTYFSVHKHDYEQLERVRHFFSWVVDYAPKHEFASQMVDLVRLAIPFLMNAGHWSILSRTLVAGHECAQLSGDLDADNLLLYHKALLYFHTGHEKLALDLLQKIIDSLREHEDWPLLLMALYMIGKTYERKGEYKQAATYYQQALDLPTVELITHIHIAYRLGRIEDLSNNPEAARRANQLALNAIRQFDLFSNNSHKKDL